MTLFTILKRIKLFFSSPTYCLYRYYFRRNPEKAESLVKHISKKAIPLQSGVEKIDLISKDGSGQYTHPDIVFFKGNYYLTATPYTFSNELIENPCLFISKDGIVFVPLLNEPVDRPSEQTVRNHLSDPAFSVYGSSLQLYYRKSTHVANNRIDEIFCVTRKNNHCWEEKKQIKFPGNSLIAPSFVTIDNRQFVYYVKESGDTTKLCIGEVVDDSIIKEKEITLNNPFTSYCIWHVDIKKNSKEYVGLFNYIEKPGAGKTQLFYGVSTDGISWTIKRKITISKNEKDICLYKSTSFILDEKLVSIISGIDKHFRWFLYSCVLEENYLL